MVKHTDIEPDDSWAQVELWRWQYGELPRPDDSRPLIPSVGLRNMAKAIEIRDPNDFPSPANVISVLRYTAKLLDDRS